jgi:hypothetical protein
MVDPEQPAGIRGRTAKNDSSRVCNTTRRFCRPQTFRIPALCLTTTMSSFTGYFLSADTFFTTQNTYLRVVVQPRCAYVVDRLLTIGGFSTRSTLSDVPVFTVTHIDSQHSLDTTDLDF